MSSLKTEVKYPRITMPPEGAGAIPELPERLSVWCSCDPTTAPRRNPIVPIALPVEADRESNPRPPSSVPCRGPCSAATPRPWSCHYSYHCGNAVRCPRPSTPRAPMSTAPSSDNNRASATPKRTASDEAHRFAGPHWFQSAAILYKICLLFRIWTTRVKV